VVLASRVTLTGGGLVEKMDKLLRQGNVRRLCIIHMGKPLIDISLDLDTASDIPVFLLPHMLRHLMHTAFSQIAELLNYCSVEIELVDRKFIYEFPNF